MVVGAVAVMLDMLPALTDTAFVHASVPLAVGYVFVIVFVVVNEVLCPALPT